MITLRLPDDIDFGDIAARLEDLGFPRPASEDGVWAGGPDLLSRIDPALTPELAYLVLDAEDHLVLASDQQGYLETAVPTAVDDGQGVDGLDAVTEAMGEPLSAAVYAGDYACAALAMGQTDADDQAGAAELVSARPAPTPTAAPRWPPAPPSVRAASSPTASRSVPPAPRVPSYFSISPPPRGSTS